MIYIAHRGNSRGPLPQLENAPGYLEMALLFGLDVEVDVWYVDGKWMTGHDAPTYKIDENRLTNPRFWCHAKNLEAFGRLLKMGAHVFWHENDERTLTSRGVIWTYPGKLVTDKFPTILVMAGKDIVCPEVMGICGDYVDLVREEHARKLANSLGESL